MRHIYFWNFKKWKHFSVIIVFAFFTAIFMWLETDGALSVFSSDKPNVLSKGSSHESNVALTFNISWGEDKVHHILKELEKNQVQATFFVSGEWAERHPDIVDKIAEGKHELGTLGYRYKSYLEQDINQVRKDLIHARDVFRKLGYDEVNLLRTPSGHFNQEVVTLAEQLSFKVIQWNINPNDWKNPGTQVIVDKIMKETTNGDIILLHASDSVKHTEGSLKVVLPGLKNKGFHFVSITELINQAHAEAKLVE